MSTEILQGDCIEVMPTMEADSVDLVFTSPPYEDARLYGIDFKVKGDAWVEWALARYLECVRVCRGLVAWVVEGRTRDFRWSATPVLLMAALHEHEVRLRKPPMFLRQPPAFRRVGIPGSGGPDWLRNDYEFIVCSSKGKLPWSDNTAMGHPPKWAPGGEMNHRVSDGSRVNQWGHPSTTGGTHLQDGKIRTGVSRPSHTTTKRYDGVTLANPGNVIECNVGGGHMGSDLAHENEAPFPEALAEFFIRSFCPDGGIVLDPFSGSGTTAAVAQKWGRNAITIDVRQSQCELTAKRVDETRTLFTP